MCIQMELIIPSNISYIYWEELVTVHQIYNFFFCCWLVWAFRTVLLWSWQTGVLLSRSLSSSCGFTQPYVPADDKWVVFWGLCHGGLQLRCAQALFAWSLKHYSYSNCSSACSWREQELILKRQNPCRQISIPWQISSHVEFFHFVLYSFV